MTYKTGSAKRSVSLPRMRTRRVVPLAPEDWDKYRGETIAFIGEQILAHGQDLDDVLQEVWERYGKKPNEVGLFKVAKARHKLL
ncbi:MAG: hypothetical protein KGJ80_19080 [Chloroflexota bacterium]|nr:hypothetical protein [Chloroflexota bacterium]